MGNCFSCFKSLPPSAPDAPVEKDKEESGVPVGSGGCGATELGHAGSLTVGEATANGTTGRGPASAGGPAACSPAPASAASAAAAATLAACTGVGAPPASAAGETPGVPPAGGGTAAVGAPAATAAARPRVFYPRLVREPLPSEAKISALFDLYRDPAEDAVLADGIERLCNDLGLSPDEFKVLVLAWRLDAARMCRFSREEFFGGLRALRVDSLGGLQLRLPEVAAEVARNTDLFKDLYRFTFRFGLDADAGQRALPSDMAACLWRLVFSVREPPILERWLQFLENHPHVRGIPRDTWNMFLNFAEAIGDDLSCYDDTEAWPSLFDDFVEYENDKANQNIAKDREGTLKDTY